MKTFFLILLITLSSKASAIMINENKFLDSGGNISDIAGSISDANEKLRNLSFQDPYFTVGYIPGCSATWLGSEGGMAYILTAAHCIAYTGEVTDIDTSFRAWDNTLIANGRSKAYVPRIRITRPDGTGGASTDIAIIKIPQVRPLKDSLGLDVENPVLYDRNLEIDKKVFLVGHGAWGVGITKGQFGPTKGLRRLYGENIIDKTFETDRGIGFSYVPFGETEFWAKILPGDSGSAWWQKHNGMDVIIATTNGGGDRFSTGARVSRYINWIKGIYSGVRTFSGLTCPDGSVMTEYGCLVGKAAHQNDEPFLYNRNLFIKTNSINSCPDGTTDDGVYSESRHCKYDVNVANYNKKSSLLMVNGFVYIKPSSKSDVGVSLEYCPDGLLEAGDSCLVGSVPPSSKPFIYNEKLFIKIDKGEQCPAGSTTDAVFENKTHCYYDIDLSSYFTREKNQNVSPFIFESNIYILSFIKS